MSTDPPAAAADAAGADVGSTLAKLAWSAPDGRLVTETRPADDLEAIASRLLASGARRIGLTGAGAGRLGSRLELHQRHFDESLAWAAGARTRLEPQQLSEPFLLVSMGTGTSVISVDGGAAARVGGTALGGGTLLGLGRQLAGAAGFAELARLAARGDRGRVDLSIGDVYQGHGAPLPDAATVSAFGKLARAGSHEPARPEDLAAAVVGLVGENVGLLCTALARVHGANRIVFGGSTLADNPPLAGLLELVCLAYGVTVHFPEHGAYLGAMGAQALMAEAPDARARSTR